MQNSFRWYGPTDPVKLTDIRQANAEYVVTSLHQIPYGEKWSKNDVKKRINFIGILKVNLALYLIYFSKNIPKPY